MINDRKNDQHIEGVERWIIAPPGGYQDGLSHYTTPLLAIDAFTAGRDGEWQEWVERGYTPEPVWVVGDQTFAHTDTLGRDRARVEQMPPGDREAYRVIVTKHRAHLVRKEDRGTPITEALAVGVDDLAENIRHARVFTTIEGETIVAHRPGRRRSD